MHNLMFLHACPFLLLLHKSLFWFQVAWNGWAERVGWVRYSHKMLGRVIHRQARQQLRSVLTAWGNLSLRHVASRHYAQKASHLLSLSDSFQCWLQLCHSKRRRSVLVSAQSFALYHVLDCFGR